MHSLSLLSSHPQQKKLTAAIYFSEIILVAGVALAIIGDLNSFHPFLIAGSCFAFLSISTLCGIYFKLRSDASQRVPSSTSISISPSEKGSVPLPATHSSSSSTSLSHLSTSSHSSSSFSASSTSSTAIPSKISLQQIEIPRRGFWLDWEELLEKYIENNATSPYAHALGKLNTPQKLICAYPPEKHECFLKVFIIAVDLNDESMIKLCTPKIDEMYFIRFKRKPDDFLSADRYTCLLELTLFDRDVDESCCQWLMYQWLTPAKIKQIDLQRRDLDGMNLLGLAIYRDYFIIASLLIDGSDVKNVGYETSAITLATRRQQCFTYWHPNTYKLKQEAWEKFMELIKPW